jgi:hypothetical protein
MTKSELMDGLLVTFATLALGGWSSILVAYRYQQSHHVSSRSKGGDLPSQHAPSESNKSVPKELTVPRDSTTSRTCVAWTDGCVNCTLVKEEQIECSNIGIACQPGRIGCLENK